ncbi:hypothetical protein KAR91_15975 [Candidatus Pacearchaeota archaeon]|nr:hypothetical protein [Candidatus Pacearchaeota archaeon]
MILKISRYYGEQEYWMLDNIAKISLSKPKQYKVDLSGNCSEAKVDYMTDEPLVTGICLLDKRLKSVDGDIFKYKVIIARLTNGEEVSISFDTVCFVMNDSGKTIEKIVVNRN